MSKGARTTRLRARAIKYCNGIMAGMTSVASWQEATPGWQDIPENDQHKRANEFKNHPLVQREMNTALEHARSALMMNTAKYLQRVMDRADRAIAANNWTAGAAYDRLVGSAANVLRETFNIADDRQSNKQLLDRLAQLSPDLAVAAGKLLVSDSFAAQDATPEPPTGTKH